MDSEATKIRVDELRPGDLLSWRDDIYLEIVNITKDEESGKLIIHTRDGWHIKSPPEYVIEAIHFEA